MPKHDRKAAPDAPVPDVPVKGRGRCPRCASRKTELVAQPVTDFYAREVEVCANCKAVWEPLPPGGDHQDDDGTPFPFPEPCDNCAFRPGSPEQQDKARWQELMAQLEAGGAFYCHKGVPITPESEDGFAYPGGGKDRRRMRLCRGYLQMWHARMRKGVARLQEDGDA